MAADIRAGRAFVELQLRNREFLRGLRRARERVRQFASDVQAAGRAMAAIGGASLAGMGVAVRVFSDFDDKMREVRAVTGATAEQFDRLTLRAKRLGATTSYTASQVAALMAELGRAGFAPEQVEEMTGAVLDMARATSTDAAQAAGIMAASIRQFGLDASEATRVADALTVAANKSFNTVESLGHSLAYAGPVAADFNMSIEETLAILGALGNVGIQGSNAGTAIRRLLTITGSEAEKLKGIFGVEFADAAGNARPLVDVLDEVNQATQGMGTAQRARLFNEAFGILGITSASAISKNVTSVKELKAALDEAAGTANRTAKEMDAGIGGAFRMMLSAIEGVAIAIGESLQEELSRTANAIEKISFATIKWIEENQQVILTIGKIAAGVTIAGSALISMGAALLAINGTLTVFSSTIGLTGAALGLIASPLRLVTIGVAALRGTLITMTAAATAARGAVIGVTGAIFSARTATTIATAALTAFRAATLTTAVGVFGLRVAVAALTAASTIARGAVFVATMSLAAYRATAVLARTATITLASTQTALVVSSQAARGGMLALRSTMLAVRGAALSLAGAQRALVVATGSVRVAFVAARTATISFLAAQRMLYITMGAARTFAVSFAAALAGLRAAFVGVATGATLAKVATAAFAAVGAVIGALTSPMAIVLAALGGLGYAAYQAMGGFKGATEAAGNAASSVFSKIGKAVEWFRDTIVPVFKTAFQGVRDAINAGDLSLAGSIAMAGLKVVFLEGAEALTGIFGDAIGKIAAQIAGGDFQGAWNTAVLQMSDLWAGFAEGMVSVFTEASRSVIDIWQRTTTGIANMLLEQSAQGGVMGKVASAILGVDLQAEQERANRLNAQLGLGPQNILDEAQQAAQQRLGGQADALRARLSGMDLSAQQRTREARQAAGQAAAGGSSGALARAREELARLTQQAAQAQQQAAAEAEERKRQAREETRDAASGSAGISDQVFGSFSAAALMAMGGQQSPAERTAKGVERLEKAIDKLGEKLKEQTEIDKAMLQEQRMGGMIA